MVGMTRQNYYKKRSISKRRQIDDGLVLGLVRRERAIQPRLGCRKLLCLLGDEFSRAGISIGRDRFFRLLREHGMLIERRRRCPGTTDSRHGFGVYGNLLADVVLTGANQALVSDITYIRTDEGFMYLALVMDAYSRAIVGYDCSDSLESRGALEALSQALRQLPAGSGALHHSDRGCQYCCGAYVGMLGKNGLRISMTEVDHCYENSRAERLNGILKDEYGLADGFSKKSEALAAVAEAVKLYNNRRPHGSIGYRFPMAYHRAA